MNDSERAELIKLYKAGATANGLARQSRVYKDTVRAIVTKAGVKRPVRPPILNEDQVAELRALHEAGETLAALTEKFGVSMETARRRLKN